MAFVSKPTSIYNYFIAAGISFVASTAYNFYRARQASRDQGVDREVTAACGTIPPLFVPTRSPQVACLTGLFSAYLGKMGGERIFGLYFKRHVSQNGEQELEGRMNKVRDTIGTPSFEGASTRLTEYVSLLHKYGFGGNKKIESTINRELKVLEHFAQVYSAIEELVKSDGGVKGGPGPNTKTSNGRLYLLLPESVETYSIRLAPEHQRIVDARFEPKPAPISNEKSKGLVPCTTHLESTMWCGSREDMVRMASEISVLELISVIAGGKAPKEELLCKARDAYQGIVSARE